MNYTSSRIVRHNDPGHAHELTFSCYKRRAFLSKNRTRQFFAEAVSQARVTYRFHVWAYVVMPEHVHMLIWPTEDPYSISIILQSIKQSVSRKAIRYLRESAQTGLHLLATGQKHRPYRFWQDGGGYDRNVTERQTLRKMVEYIHNNPVRRGIAEYAEEWEWSSAQDWLNGKEGHIAIDRESFPL